MGALLYFAPSAKGMTLDGMAELGIDTTGVVGPGNTRCITSGPNGSDGLVFVPHFEGHDVSKVTAGYYPDRQKWEQAPGRDYWIGYYLTERPGPSDLIRIKCVNGYPLELADGNQWMIPVGRLAEGGAGATPLPRLTRFDGKKHFQGEVVPQYQWLFDVGTRSLEILLGEREDGYTYAETADICCRLLAINYHVGPCEIDLLRLFSEANQLFMLRYVGDSPGFMAIKKKEAADIASLSAGAAGSCETTNPQRQTS
jgi:hypothetical protein